MYLHNYVQHVVKYSNVVYISVVTNMYYICKQILLESRTRSITLKKPGFNANGSLEMKVIHLSSLFPCFAQPHISSEVINKSRTLLPYLG